MIPAIAMIVVVVVWAVMMETSDLSQVMLRHQAGDLSATTKHFRNDSLHWSIVPTPLAERIHYERAFLKCPIGEAQSRHKRRIGLTGVRNWSNNTSSSRLQELINFKVSWPMTNLSILVFGDSIGGQIHDWLAEASNATVPTTATSNEMIVAQTQGGGMLAFLRVDSLFTMDIMRILEHKSANYTHHADVCLFRIPYPHIGFDQISSVSLEQTIQNIKTMFTCHQVLLLTVPLNNNINTKELTDQYYETNAMIRTFASSHTPLVALVDLDRLMRALIVENGRSMSLSEDESFQLRLSEKSKWQPLQALLCQYRTNGSMCEPNMITVDGMHPCPETVAGRFTAGVACLVECNADDSNCHDECNGAYLTLRPIENKT